MTFMVAPAGEDRWFAVIEGCPLPGETLDEFLDAFPPDHVEPDLEVAVRACAAFGMEWAVIDGEVSWAMMGLLAQAPPDFSVEFMRWSAPDLRSLRERWVAGGSASFFEAIRCLHRYRFAASLDIRPPIRAGD